MKEITIKSKKFKINYTEISVGVKINIILSENIEIQITVNNNNNLYLFIENYDVIETYFNCVFTKKFYSTEKLFKLKFSKIDYELIENHLDSEKINEPYRSYVYAILEKLNCILVLSLHNLFKITK